MKILKTIILSVVCLHCSFAQKQANIWYFGMFAGLDFSSGSPVALTNGALYTSEGNSTISDSAGNLLFYTDGIMVYNRNHVQMPNGFGLNGNVSTTQTQIIPNPGNPDLYYIFTLDHEGFSNGFNYSQVDMALDSGRGDVAIKNTFLKARMTEKVAGIYHCNNHDIWVMAHEFGTNTFLAYLVTDNGLSASPVISNVGTIHDDINNANVHGQMKFTSDGKKVACAIDRQQIAEIFDFDNKTGIVSNPFTLTLSSNPSSSVYGLEFSPDNSKLYVTYVDGGTGFGTLVQFDLNAPDIQATMVILGTSEATDPFHIRGLQLSPDQKIYVATGIPFVGVINSPDLAGTSCDYVANAINLDPQGFGIIKSELGLPGFIQSYFHPDFPFEECTDIAADFTSSDTVICIGDCISFSELSACTTDSWQWSFIGASPDSSAVRNPSNICYASPGNFYAELIVSNGCLEDTIRKTITVVPFPALDAGADIIMRTGESTSLNAIGDVVIYQWTPAEGLSATNIRNPVATPSITTTYYVTGTNENGCEAFDSVMVIVESPCGEVAIPSAFTPNGDGANEKAVVLGECISTMYFAIYNRWGEKVFETNKQTEGWDGTYKGEPQPISSFVYYLDATLETGEPIFKKGSISLIR